MLYTFNNASDYWDNGILTLSLFGHIAQMSDESDAKQILTASPLENWRRPPGRPRIMWIDYPAGPGVIEPLPERSNWRGSELSTL